MCGRFGYFLAGCCVLAGFTESSLFAQSDSKPGPSIRWINPPQESDLPLPTGVAHHTFPSELVDQDIGYCIYLPPSYRADSSRRFPVIYNLHGNGGDELRGLNAAELLHEQITKGIVPPMIMTFFNGGHSTFYKDSADGRYPIESIFIDEFIPMIDANYRTISDRSGRCIEGFSMGGRGATRLVVRHPELFCSLNCQAGNVPHLLEIYDQTPPDERGGLLLGDERSVWEANDVYAVTRANRDKINDLVRIQILCGTKDGGHIQTIRDFHDLLLELDIDHTYLELDGLVHNRVAVMRRLAPLWFDHHVRAMKATID